MRAGRGGGPARVGSLVAARPGRLAAAGVVRGGANSESTAAGGARVAGARGSERRGSGALAAGSVWVVEKPVALACASGESVVVSATRKTWIAESGLTDVKWSRAQFVSHDDGIALEASPAAPGQTMVADIEMALVHPRVRLGDRYAGGI